MVKVKKKKQTNLEMGLVYRIILSGIFFILGFSLSYSSFFRDNPLYGVKFLAEILISITAATIGFYLIPMLIMQMKDWIETLIIDTVSDIVGSFWEQQTKNINERKKLKQKQKSEEEKRKLDSALENALVIDTSVLVDGRILDIVKTGFVSNTLVIPAAVTNELHTISDSEKKLKRERGRRGLDIATKLSQETKILKPEIATKEKDVDRIILNYAKERKLKLMTLDFNLNKLAKANGVKVLNINDLVDAVKISALPGEMIQIEIVQPGKEKKQGIGYMPDGTMLVVEEAKDLVGKQVEAKVQRVIQSSAGKIIFCDINTSQLEQGQFKK